MPNLAFLNQRLGTNWVGKSICSVVNIRVRIGTSNAEIQYTYANYYTTSYT